MAKLQKIIEHLNEILNINDIHDFCPNGLQVEGPLQEITQVTTAVSASLETLKQAVTQQAQLLIVHHGIFWNKDPYPIVGIKKEKIKLLLDHEISLLAYHLPLGLPPRFWEQF